MHIIIKQQFGLKKTNSRETKVSCSVYLQILPPIFPFQFASACFKLWCTSLQCIWTQYTIHSNSHNCSIKPHYTMRWNRQDGTSGNGQDIPCFLGLEVLTPFNTKEHKKWYDANGQSYQAAATWNTSLMPITQHCVHTGLRSFQCKSQQNTNSVDSNNPVRIAAN